MANDDAAEFVPAGRIKTLMVRFAKPVYINASTGWAFEAVPVRLPDRSAGAAARLYPDLVNIEPGARRFMSPSVSACNFGYASYRSLSGPPDLGSSPASPAPPYSKCRAACL